jgi:cytochrome c551/c552
MQQKTIRWICAVLVLVALNVSIAGVLKIELPPETQSFKPTPGAGLANGNCLTCHSVEYVAMQPPLSSTGWTAEVKKMRDKYGAHISEDQIAPIVDYLTRTYGVVTNGQPTAPAAESLSSTNLGVVALATHYGCLSCHGVSAKIVGPAYKDVATKYRDDPKALEKIAAQIHNGGSGKWGSVLMPPFPMVNDADTKMLADWIMSQAK